MADSEIALLGVTAFVPCIMLAAWARWAESRQRQSMASVILVFLMGATVSVGMAVVLEIALDASMVSGLRIPAKGALAALLSAVMLAPLVEEFTKAVPVLAISRSSFFLELDDGLVYGAAAGLGFAATENLLYFFVAWRRSLLLPPELGVAALLGTITVRSFGGAALHGAATSLTGYGISTQRFLRGTLLSQYVRAAAVHSAYNFSVFAFGVLLTCGVGGLCPVTLVFGLAMGLGLFATTIQRIRTIDAQPSVQPVWEWQEGAGGA